MKLFKISQTVNGGYDTFDSAVVAAPNEIEARRIHPGGNWKDDVWCHSPEDVKVELIGEASKGTKKGLILASFNAG